MLEQGGTRGGGRKTGRGGGRGRGRGAGKGKLRVPSSRTPAAEPQGDGVRQKQAWYRASRRDTHPRGSLPASSACSLTSTTFEC